MDEWGVFLVIVAILSFAAAIVAPVLKLNTAIVKLTDSVDMLRDKFDEQKTDNTNAHKRIWDRVDSHEFKINDHETRLGIIEREREVKK